MAVTDVLVVKSVGVGLAKLAWRSVATEGVKVAAKEAEAVGARAAAPNAGAVLREQYGAKFEEYMVYRNQGFTPAQAKYLSEPYVRAGHHFPIRQATARKLGLPDWLRDNPLNVLKPSGISRGQFYELHYRVDPTFFGTRFPKSIGGTWEGNALGLQKYDVIERVWYGSSTPLKITTGTTIVGGSTLGGYYLLQDKGGNQ